MSKQGDRYIVHSIIYMCTKLLPRYNVVTLAGKGWITRVYFC